MLMEHTAVGGGLTVRAHVGDGSVLLAFSLPRASIGTRRLAGFAIRCTPPSGKSYYLPNRLSFAQRITSETTPEERVWTPSDEAPFQKFHWAHYPPDVEPGRYRYEVTARFWKDGALADGPSGTVTATLERPQGGRFELGFTRGYLSSQAYATRFHNAPVRPPGAKKLLFDTKSFEERYEWLGAHARRMIMEVLDECVKDPKLRLDVFAYDLDEPDIVRGLVALKKRVRVLLDNATLHTGAKVEMEAAKRIRASAGNDAVVRGHFGRFSHDKVFIVRRTDGTPIRVLTGSANFSVRGLYVQANNVLRFDDANVAKLYASVFDHAFDNETKGFAATPMAQRWFEFANRPGLPDFSVCFSPHRSSSVSLDRVAKAIGAARSSVFFAVMELGGSGAVLKSLKAAHETGTVLSLGMTQNDKGFKVYKPGEPGVLVPFSALDKHVPAPFTKEWRGGSGQVIHDKFVVIDFNGTNPIVYTGSSNLAAGGETENGDNLLEIRDPAVASAFAVEAIRLVDHYQFRAVMERATEVKPLMLQPGTDVQVRPWWQKYYEADDVHTLTREALVR